MSLSDLAPLNFAKIKHFLMTSNAQRGRELLDHKQELKICATLQALRWRLTKAKRKTLVKQVIHLYMNHDLLGCLPQDKTMDQGHRILDRLL
jgi:hypothetical protein